MICTVGINYTQDERCSSHGDLFRYREGSIGGVGVVRQTQSTAAVVSVVSAYQRNTPTWTTTKAPESPFDYYGAPDATSRIGKGKIEKDDFILIMTNVCPFITKEEWAKQQPHVSEALLKECSSYTHLDDLYDTLGASIDLWIGHSAIGGKKWVWPRFVQHRGIKQWLLTENISPRSHLWFEGAFRKERNALFPWYGSGSKQKPLARANRLGPGSD